MTLNKPDFPSFRDFFEKILKSIDMGDLKRKLRRKKSSAPKLSDQDVKADGAKTRS
jgi:hypothetical protein